MKIISIIGLCMISIAPLWANEEKGVKKQTDLALVGTTEPGVAVFVEQRFLFPFLQGETPLTEDNNIMLKLRGQVTPTSFELMSDTVWTPFAAMNFSLGAQLGVGWNYYLGASFLNGLGLYQRSADGKSMERAKGDGWDGVVWNIHGGMRLQFDFAAVLPGDWNHVIVRIDNIVNYQNYTMAKGSQRWYFRNDDDLYENWFAYNFTGVFGYQMPLFFDMAAVMFELSLPFYNPQSGKSFPDKEPEMILSLVTNWKITERISLMALCQFQNILNHPVTTDYEREWQFYRVMIVGTWSLF